MPSNWLYIDTNFPSFTQKESVNDKVETMQDYLFMLVEQLRYTLHNLDLSNMNKAAADGFVKTITASQSTQRSKTLRAASRSSA